VSAVLERPSGAPRWSDAAREAFREDWYAKYTGSGSHAGGTPILEDGMTLNRVDYSATDQQYIEGVQLSFTTVASVFHINPTMVGVLDNANYSNVREFRKMLYGDTLGPIIAQVESALNAWLLPIMGVDDKVYVEFNVAEKLQGDFEAQSQFFQSAVGRPYMSANEARARLNLRAVAGGDDIVTPLNVLVGGQASPQDSVSSGSGIRTKSGGGIPDWVAGVAREYKNVLSGDTKDAARAKRLKNISLSATARAGRGVVREHGSGDYDPDRTEDYIETRADGIEKAWEDAPDHGDEAALVFGLGLALWDYSWGRLEAGRQNGAVTKTWVTTSSNPRPEHAAINGETVGIDDEFSNGLRWPGDSASGDPAEVANCQCEVVVNWK
jgi:phage portal protein